jgi:hypothetical protein
MMSSWALSSPDRQKLEQLARQAVEEQPSHEG